MEWPGVVEMLLKDYPKLAEAMSMRYTRSLPCGCAGSTHEDEQTSLVVNNAFLGGFVEGGVLKLDCAIRAGVSNRGGYNMRSGCNACSAAAAAMVFERVGTMPQVGVPYVAA
jgi:hypothetical protein